MVLLIGSDTPVNENDLLCIVWLITCLGVETAADEQQWVYQNAKHATPSKSTRSHSRQSSLPSYCQPADLKRGFITGGLFRYSRHPNFACEQAIWCLFYFFGCIATVPLLRAPSYDQKTFLNWTIVAPLSLITVIFLVRTLGLSINRFTGLDHSDRVDYGSEISV